MKPGTPKTVISLVDEELTLYCEASTSEEPPICRTIREYSHTHPKTHWISGPLVGTLLQSFVSIMHARRVLDIGTFFGYSAAYMASGNSDVCVVSIEADAALAAEAQSLLSQSSLSERVTIHNITATEWLAANPCEQFDVVFFDSNRENLMQVYPLLLNTVKIGGVLVMDNACLRGRVLRPLKPWEVDTVLFNQSIQRDPRFLTSLLPVRDGILIAHRLGAR
jgi:caffeoyl-CoA O-methyltransferase